MKSHNSLYFVREGVRSIFAHGLMSFAAIGIIIACLLIMGSFALIAVNLEAMLSSLEKENEILAFVDEGLTEAEARRLQTQLEEIENVTSCRFITNERAMAEFIQEYEDDLFQEVPASTLRHRYQIYLVDIEQMSETVERLEAVEGISKVRAELDIVRGLIAVRNIAGVVALILIAVLLLISLFIIANTIRLAAFTRREEIAIMKMCGATNGFIRWPFVYEGLIIGVLGALAALLLQWGLYSLIVQAVDASDTLRLISLLPFRGMATSVGLVFLGTGVVIGAGGSIFAINKFLRV